MSLARRTRAAELRRLQEEGIEPPTEENESSQEEEEKEQEQEETEQEEEQEHPEMDDDPPQEPEVQEVEFFLTPAQSHLGIIDLKSKDGKKQYYSACSKLSEESFECDAENLHDFLTLLKVRGYDNEWVNTIFMIPKDKDDLESEKISIIDNHGELSIEAIRAFELSYISMPQRQAQDTLMLSKCLMASLSREGRRKVNMDKSMYILSINGRDYTSGNLLLKVILTKSHLDSHALARGIRAQLASLDRNISKSGYNITKFNDKVKLLISDLSARGEKSHDLSYNLMKAYNAVPGDQFKMYMSHLNNEVDSRGDIEPSVLMSRVETKYKTLLNDKDWNVPSDQEKKIIALEAKVRDLKKSSKAGKGKGGHKGNHGSKDKPGKGNNKNPFPGKEKTTPPSGDLSKPVMRNGKNWYWCSKETGGKCSGIWRMHKPSDCRGPGGVPNPQAKSGTKRSTPDKKDHNKSSHKKSKLRLQSAYAKTATMDDSLSDTSSVRTSLGNLSVGSDGEE